MITQTRFVDEYLRAIDTNTCGVFAGAGISVSAGFPDWRTLLHDIAKELDLDIQREADLAGVMQFHLNRNARTRTRIAAIVRDAFPNREEAPTIHRVVARLPIRRVWTTNFDTLFETAFRQEAKSLDVKLDDRALTAPNEAVDATLFKLHGCRSAPADVVIARDDFELYKRRRPGMLDALKSDVFSRTLLFLGLSFSDSNLASVLSSVREMFDDVPRRHYALIREPHRDDYEKSAGGDLEWKYAANRFKLWIEDLLRYGIEALVINEYDQIDETLLRLERKFLNRSLFVSGSLPQDDTGPAELAWVPEFMRHLGQHIIDRGRNLVSGFGLVIGSHLIMGALERFYRTANASDAARRLKLRPFPQAMPAGMSREEFLTRHRSELVKEAGIVIVVAGIKDGAATAGVFEECTIARSMGRFVIPIGASGGAAREEWLKAMAAPKTYVRDDSAQTMRHLEILGNDRSSPEAIMGALWALIDGIDAI